MIRNRALLISLAVSAVWHVFFFGALHITVRLPIFYKEKPVVVMFSAVPSRSEQFSARYAGNAQDLNGLLRSAAEPLAVSASPLFALQGPEAASQPAASPLSSSIPELLQAISVMDEADDASFLLAELDMGSSESVLWLDQSSAPLAYSLLELKSRLALLRDTAGIGKLDNESASQSPGEMELQVQPYIEELLFAPDIIESQASYPLPSEGSLATFLLVNPREAATSALSLQGNGFDKSVGSLRFEKPYLSPSEG